MIVGSRKKPRPGRLKDGDLAQLRVACFERDNYQCQNCGMLLTGLTAHMAHIGAKRRYGDSLENVRTECKDCHRASHTGGKVLKRK